MSLSRISAPPLPIETGEFLPTWTGFSVAPTDPVNYSIVGNLVALWVQDALNPPVGTSNSTSFAMADGSIPLVARPLIAPGAALAVFCYMLNNSAFVQGIAQINAAGGVTFGNGPLQFGGGWTASGLKGLPVEWLVTYPKR